MRKKTLKDLTAREDDRIVVRVDFNVPIRDGRVTDDTRIERTLPTLRRLTACGARLVLLSHLGRPGGRPRPEASLEPVAARLGQLLGENVRFSPESAGPDALARARALAPGEILVAENTRFLEGETRNDPQLAGAFAALGNHFVNDAFGTAHRAHASTAGLALAMRARGGEAVAGLLLEREIRFLGDALEDPERPFVAVLGGAKVSDKIAVVEKMLARADRVLVGGAMANTFFRALGLETGRSLVDEEGVELAARLMDQAGDSMMLPVDCVVAPRIAARRDPPRGAPGRGRSRGPNRRYRRRKPAHVRGRAGAGAHHRLERTRGRIRDAAVRRRNHRRSAIGGGSDRFRGGDHRRRWRLGRRGAGGRVRRRFRARLQPAEAPRWRFWRARPSPEWRRFRTRRERRTDAAGKRRDGRAQSSWRPNEEAGDRRKLEDAPRARGRPPVLRRVPPLLVRDAARYPGLSGRHLLRGGALRPPRSAPGAAGRAEHPPRAAGGLHR